MSDKSRNEKIASAKKRLQKFRNKKDGSNEIGGGGSTKSKQRRAGSGLDAAAAAIEPSLSAVPAGVDEAAGMLSGNGDAAASSNGSHADAASPERPLPPPPPPPSAPEVENDASGASVSGATESLMQLSQQINGIMSWDSPDQLSQQRAQHQQSLERRNVELAHLLEARTEALEQARRSHAQLREQLQRLQAAAAADLATVEERHRRELLSSREQQAGQAQAIGLLVAEKTELGSQLAHAQRMCQQRLSELTDAQERLRAARTRLTEAERALAASEMSTAQLNLGGREAAKEVERLRAELQRTAGERAEWEQAAAELRAKLAAKGQATVALEEQNRDLRRQLELAGVQLHQLGASRDRDSRAAAADLQASNAQLTERLAQLAGERDSLSEQYKEYTGRLGSEVKQLRAQLSAAGTERSQLVNRLAELDGQAAGLRAQVEAAMEAAAAAEAEAARLRLALDEAAWLRSTEAEERQRLLELVEDRESACERLRTEMRSARTDQQRLADSVQSDRNCLSRALQQNRELKSQVEELQTGFVAASNRGAELTGQLHSEQHLAKELAARLGEQEDELRELREDLTAREDELRSLKLAYQSARETLLYRQPDGSGGVVDPASPESPQHRLSQELASAQARVNQLTASNSELMALLYRSQQQEQRQSAAGAPASAQATSLPPSPSDAAAARSRNQSTAGLQASVDQLESERNSLLRTVEDLRAALAGSGGAAVAHVSRAEFEEMQRARLQLEEKFHQAMDRVAVLQDDKERLEHTLMQLEVETETIGEYVTLYQYQRSQLHQRELEKEASMLQLSAEREQMRLKLSELETLVRHLMSGGGVPQQRLPGDDAGPSANQRPPQRRLEGVHQVEVAMSDQPSNSLATSRILDIISQLHDDASAAGGAAGDTIRVMQCPCCHGSVIDL